jgi:5'-deoxynucleotidase YfbR-like HD superfamily hydrolase
MITTFTGRTIDPTNFKKEDIDLRDIAISMSRQNRYMGHTSNEWSVGQHSILCGMLAAHFNFSEDTQRAVVLHDIHETWLQDVSSPISKAFMTLKYSEAKNKIDHVVYAFFGAYDSFVNLDTQKIIHRIDRLAYLVEEVSLRAGFDYIEYRKTETDEKLIEMADSLFKTGYRIDASLVNMSKGVVAQSLLELLSVLHFEAVSGGEVVIDETTVMH